MTQRGAKLPDRVPNPKIATLHEDSDGDVTLTLRKGKFAEFIFGFLGAKETLSKTYNHDFTIKLEDLFQFHYLLIQKIEKEQFISMALETATILYDDNTNRTINTFESIEKYSEYRDVGVLAFELTWNFIFKVQNQQEVQQQKVTVFFETINAISQNGSISVKIEHTNQVWATEVLSLFEQQISKLYHNYSNVYRALQFVKRFALVDFIGMLCIVFIIGGGIYVMIQRSALSEPCKTQSEFIFDMSDVITNNLYNNDLNSGLLLQFFLLRDLRHEPSAIVDDLRKKGLFDIRYNTILNKLVSGYYDNGKKSERIGSNMESFIQEIHAIQNIYWIWTYLKFAILYLVCTKSAEIYLKIFRIKSILAITTKGTKQMERQDKEKSILMQFIFGVLASVVAAGIYEYTIRLLLIK